MAKQESLATRVERFRDGLVSGKPELVQIAVLQLNKILSDHTQADQAAKLMVSTGTPKLLCYVLFQEHKPEVRECATCCLAALASYSGSSGEYMRADTSRQL